MSNVYRIADKNIKITSLFSFIHVYCRGYEADCEPDFEIQTTESDIKAESQTLRAEVTGEWLEISAVYRKIAEIMPEFDTLMIHGSAISVDGEGYLFTAKSGTGKSTHTRLWRELLGDRTIIVNDDKPFVKIVENGARIYGTPYCGKEGLNTNISVPLKAVCILERSEENRIEQIEINEAFPMLIHQTYHPSDKRRLMRVLELLDRLKGLVNFYHLFCNTELKAAEISYNAMKG